ncbi:MAG: DUF4290 domain-containing protein, partial [Saprospiraceae bacterium]|nr:DUF4290 domain-containing protein [Saprospiraceae bacterium]
SYMKLAYKTWNREHYVSDDVVKEDLEILSDGQLILHEGHDSLDKLAAGAGKHDKERRQQNQRGRSNKPQQNNNGGSSRNRNNKRGSYGNNYRKRKK